MPQLVWQKNKKVNFILNKVWTHNN